MEVNTSEDSANAKLACLSCRQKKVKCDKSRPCARCVANSVECVYPDMRGQTGPAPGRAEVLRKKIKELKKSISEQRERNIYLEKQYQVLKSKIEHNDLLVGGHMVNAHMLNTFLGGYLKNGFSYLQVTPPFQNVNDYYSKNGSKSTLMATIFGVGALLMGDKVQASKFVRSIEASIQQSFDEVNPHLCATYLILSGHFASLGDSRKEVTYNNRALAIANVLKKRSEVQSNVIDPARVARCCNVTKTICEEDTEGLSELVVAMPNNDFDIMSWTSVHTVNCVLQWAITATHKMDPTFVHPSNMHRMHTLLDLAEGLIRKLPNAFQCTLLLRLFAARIMLHVIAVEDSEANAVCKQLLDLMSELDPTMYDSPFFVLTPLVIVGQFYMLFGTYTNEFITFLQVASKFDTANVVRGLLFHEISRGDIDDMVSWSYFYPRLATYRELNSQTLALMSSSNSNNSNNNIQQPQRVGGLSINSLIEN